MKVENKKFQRSRGFRVGLKPKFWPFCLSWFLLFGSVSFFRELKEFIVNLILFVVIVVYEYQSWKKNQELSVAFS